jgi:hypothetical protein
VHGNFKEEYRSQESKFRIKTGEKQKVNIYDMLLTIIKKPAKYLVD